MREYGIHDERVWTLANREPCRGNFVLYWMQQAQREDFNHALEYAVLRANDLSLPLVVVFGLTEKYPEANLRHFTFLLEGLRETSEALGERGIPLVVRLGHPPAVAAKVAERAALLVTDRGYLRHQKKWREEVIREVKCPVIEVETDVVVPLNAVSDHAEFAARTIRPKIHRVLKRYLVSLRRASLGRRGGRLHLLGLDLDRPEAILKKMNIDRGIGAVTPFFRGGTSEARKRFARFLDPGLKQYVADRNEPSLDHTSHMSPYLHFGQISPLRLALEVAGPHGQGGTNGDESDAREAFLEQLIVRRELAMNFVHFHPRYDDYSCLPDWARRTLAEHRKDRREHVYARTALERAETHDPFWNAATREMLATGYMHNYMRMYWAKKILEWTRDPAEGFRRTLEIMNKYFLDGRDPNSYAGVAWTYGMHDQGWPERPVTGKIRILSASGLKRKTDMPAYLKRVDELASKPDKGKRARAGRRA